MKYPLQERLIDSRGKSPVYEEFKARFRRESMQPKQEVQVSNTANSSDEEQDNISEMYQSKFN